MSNNFPGGLIRKTPVTPAGPLQNGAAPGMWTLAEASYWVKQGLWPTQGNTLAVEDVFSTWLYTGNGSTQTITNGINLSGQGGLVWAKPRITGNSHILTDTARGVANTLATNFDGAQNVLETNALNSFNSNGFTLNNSIRINANGEPTVSWTFREAPNFFDVVTYTGNGANRTIAHNLGVAPGCIIVKRTDATADWQVYHRSLANTQYTVLNTNAAVATGATRWNSTTPTATEFSVGTDATVNASGGTYVAYLYAHVPGSDGIIQCGSVNAGFTGIVTADLGWEPQWVLIKCTNESGIQDNGGGWWLQDNMRGFYATSLGQRLQAQSAAAEDGFGYIRVTSTGFTSGASFNANANFIYIAIRRGPMRTPTLGTSVFSPVANSSEIGPSTPVSLVPPASDLWLSSNLGGAAPYWQTRLMGWAWLRSSSTSAQDASYTWTQRTQSDLLPSGGWWNAGTPQVNYFFRRAPGFMDVVCYTGNDQVNRAINHNLSVLPELIILKSRFISGWFVYSPLLQAGRELFLDQDGGQFTYSTNFASSLNSATVFGIAPSAGTAANVNVNGINYVSYLFASCPGVSKVGTYTGNGSSQTINCAFTTGARFVLIKRTDSTGGWLVWDSARGIVAGNDPYLALNSTAAQVTSDDSVDTDNTGFIVNQVAASNINVNAATYIFLAIA